MDLSTDCGAYPESGSYPTSDSPSSIDNKRANKPLVERKRRGRINKSIDELKEIVLQALNKDDKDYCKMEKADILEMVVRHLKTIRRNQITVESMGEPVPVWNHYRAGFTECASEVMSYLRGAHGVQHTVQIRMLSHLADCIQRVNAFPATDTTAMTPARHVALHHHKIGVTSRLPTTSPVRHVTSSPPPRHNVTSSRSAVTPPCGTPEGILPGLTSSSPPCHTYTSVSTSTTSPPVTIKHEQPDPVVEYSADRAVPSSPAAPPPVDQIVPGSSPHSPGLDLENTSMVSDLSPTDFHIKRTSPVAVWSHHPAKVADRCRLTQLKEKSSNIRSLPSMTSASVSRRMTQGEDRKSASVTREAYSRNVWRPW